MAAPIPMTDLPARIWSGADWHRLGYGYRAVDMDEKWQVAVEDGVARLYRSWTGNQIFEATFAPCEGGRVIASALVESLPDRYRRTSEKYDRTILELVLSAIVLGEPATELGATLVRLARAETGRADLPSGVILHSALGLRTATEAARGLSESAA
ncbi:hypothetical protein ACFQX7_32145 [Luedemannella flava]